MRSCPALSHSHFLSAVLSVKENTFRVQGYLHYQELADFFYKGPDSEWFRLCRSHSPWWNYLALLLRHESSQRPHTNEWMWLRSNETLLMDPEIKFHFIFTSANITLKLLEIIKMVLTMLSSWVEGRFGPRAIDHQPLLCIIPRKGPPASERLPFYSRQLTGS